jgi:hypothetical protein
MVAGVEDVLEASLILTYRQQVDTTSVYFETALQPWKPAGHPAGVDFTGRRMEHIFAPVWRCSIQQR